MPNNNSDLTGISALFRALDDSDRGRALAHLSSLRYAPHLEALPDVFSVVPTTATQEQSDNIIRGMLAKLASNLASASISGDYSDVIPSSANDITSLSGDSQGAATINFAVPQSPIAASVSFIRHSSGGNIPLDLVGIMNGYPTTPEGKYTRVVKNVATGDADIIGEDGELEGGFLSKVKGLASKALKVGAALANNPIASAALSIVPGGGAVMKGIQLANKVMDSGLGKAASGILGKMGGLGAMAGKIAGMAKGSIPSLAKAAGLASAGATPTGPAVSPNTTMGQVLNSPNLLDTLDKTFGPDKVNDAFLHILAAEGDFVDDVMSGRVLSGPSAYDPGVADLASGDWTDSVRDMLNSTADTFQQYAAKTKAAGTSAYSKLDPKLQQFLNENWGKIAAGTGAVAASAALYAGASKVMKDKEAQARMRVLQAKLDAARVAEAKQKQRLEAAKVKKAVPKPVPSSAIPSDSTPILPPLDSTSMPFAPGTPVSDGSPSSMEVSAKFIKVPFAGSVMTDMEGEGAKLLKDMRSALLSVNPGFLSGDMPNMSYEAYGATFITHGLPLSSVSVIFASDVPLFEEEKSLGMKITSPYLTRRILEAALKITDPRNSSDSVLVKDKSGRFVPFSSIPQLLSPAIAEKAKEGRYLRHMPRALQAEARAGIADKNALSYSVNAIESI